MRSLVCELRNSIKLLVVLSVLLTLSACGGGGSSNPGPGVPGPQPVDVNGGGVKGPLINAILTVYLLDYSQPDFKGAVVDTGTTGADASIMGLSFVPTGGPYLFEFTSDPVGPPPTTDLTTGMPPVISTMRTVIINDAQLANFIYGTPLTTMAVDLAILNADSNVAPYSGNNDGATTEQEFLAALEIAKGQVLSTLGFGLDSGVDIFTASPIINSDTTGAISQTQVAQYRTAIEAMTAIVAEMAAVDGGSADDMFAAVIADLADDSEVNGSPTGSPIDAAEITILEDPNPGLLIIPNTMIPVDDVEIILADERAGTGNGDIDPSPMLPVDPAPAETVSNIDGDAHPDSGDNCPTVVNDDQADINSNGVGNACDTPVSVPNVVGLTQANAGTEITNANLVVGNITEEFSNSVAAGLVVSQDPATGEVLHGSTVDLVVSLGPDFRDVPNVVGMTEIAAGTAITGQGLIVGNVTYQFSNSVAVDVVISQNPASGQLVVGSPVDLVVSLGPDLRNVPDVVGMTEAAAGTAITGQGLVVGNVNYQFSNSIAVGIVISQSPSGGQLLVGSPVTLVVSLGPDLRSVPVVVGMTETAAGTAVTGQGLIVGNVTYEFSATVAIDIVISQNPASGQLVVGSPVDLVVSLGPDLRDVPSVVGMTESAAATAITNEGLVPNITYQNSDTVTAGLVISQNPTSGQLPVGDAVEVVVSLGISTTPPADLSGIWKLQPTGSSIQDCLSASPGNARYLLTFPQLVQYMSVSQPGGGNAVTITYQNGITASGSFNADGSLVINNGSRNWTDGHGFATDITYEISGSFVAGTPDTLDLAIVDNTSSGSDSCSQTINYTAEFVYSPTGSEDYNGTYITESLDTTDMGPEIDRESMVFGAGILGSTGKLIFTEDDGTLIELFGPATLDTSSGLATFTFDEVIPDDVDGDGLVDDIEHNQITMFTLFVRSDTDVSGAPTMVNVWYETSLEYQDTAVLPAPGTPPFAVDNIFAQGYGRLVQAEGYTMSNHRPINNGPGEEDVVTLGVLNPPILHLDGFATNTFEIIEDSSSLVRCSGTYESRIRIRETFPEHVPQADMALEEFLPGSYSFMNCNVDPANVIDNGAYTMEISDSGGGLRYSIPITATPTTFATSITNRRQINVNGALSSRTRRGDPIRLHGYFNSSLGSDLPVVVPVSTDPDIEFYRLRFFNSTEFPALVADFTSATNSFIIPGDSIFDSENGINLDLRLFERYNRAGNRKAQSRSRKLRMQAGIRALVNTEVVNPTTGEVATGQAWLNGSNEFPNTTICRMTRPLDGSVTCSAGTINFTTNTITIPVTIGGIGTTMIITFTDSVTGTATVIDPIDGNWTGTARVVNPELSARSQIDRNGNMRTDIVYTNPLAPASGGAAGGTGVLSSDSNQDLGLGAGFSLELWNGDYSSFYNSYIQTPLDGVRPQGNGAYLATNTASVGLLSADSIRLVENGRTFRVDYSGADPSSMMPPSRNQTFLNFGSGDVAADTFNFSNQTEITSPLMSITWDHTPSAAPADTRWQIRLREVLTAGDDHVPHSETRTTRLADGEGGLSFDPNVGINGRWTWVVGPDFEIPSTGIWKFNVRVSDPANTIRGIGQGVIMVDQVGNL